MLYNPLNEEDESSFQPPPTPIMENDLNKIKEGESYGCTQCSSNIEIFYIDDKNFKISFKCQNNNESHGELTLPIGNFLVQTTKNTYIYRKYLHKYNDNNTKNHPFPLQVGIYYIKTRYMDQCENSY